MTTDSIHRRIFCPDHLELLGKYDGVTVADIRKFEKVAVKARKAELDLNFLRNCKTFNVFPRFLCFQLPNTSGHDYHILAMRKRLLRSAITRRTKENTRLLLVKKQLLSDISSNLNSVYFYILRRSVGYDVKKAVKKIVKTHWRRSLKD